MLFQQYKGPFNPVAWTEGKFPHSLQRAPVSYSATVSMKFVDKLSIAYARAELPSTLQAQTGPEQSHPLPASQSAAAEPAQHRPALPPAPGCHSVPTAAEQVLTPATCSCQCSSTSAGGRTFFIDLQHHGMRLLAEDDVPFVWPVSSGRDKLRGLLS